MRQDIVYVEQEVPEHLLRVQRQKLSAFLTFPPCHCSGRHDIEAAQHVCHYQASECSG